MPRSRQTDTSPANRASPAHVIRPLRCLDPVFLRGYHPTLKLSGIPTFTFIVSLTHRMDNIQINLQYNINFLAIGVNVTWL